MILTLGVVALFVGDVLGLLERLLLGLLERLLRRLLERLLRRLLLALLRVRQAEFASAALALVFTNSGPSATDACVAY